MARILPDTPPRVASSEVVKVFQSFKKLSDDFEIWHNMGFQKQKVPDFLMLHNGHALLVEVSSATVRDAKFASQLTLLDGDQVPMGKLEEEVLSTFISSLDVPSEYKVGSVVIFPHISDD